MSQPVRAQKAGLDLPFRWWDGILVLVLVFLIVGSAVFLLEWGTLWSQLIAAGLIVGYLALRKRLDGQIVFGDRVSTTHLLLGVGLGLFGFALLAAVLAIARTMVGWHDPVYPDWVLFRSLMEVPISALVGTVVLAPVLEEVIFRSILYRGLLASLNIPLAALISALAFSSAHYFEDGGIVRAAGAFLMSLLIVWLYHRTKSLWPPIALHATYNAALVLFGFIAARIVGWGTTLP